MSFDPVLGPLGLLLLYAAPGLGLSAALFPEKFSRRSGWEELVEIAVLAVVMSVAVTILLGSMLAAIPSGFSSTWSSPTLLAGDGAIAAVGGVVGMARRGASPPLETLRTPATDAAGWDTLRSLEAMAQEERRLRRTLHRLGPGGPERSAVEARLSELQVQRDALRRAREAQHAS